MRRISVMGHSAFSSSATDRSLQIDLGYQRANAWQWTRARRHKEEDPRQPSIPSNRPRCAKSC